MPRTLSGEPYNANSVIMKLGDLETVYGIDITRANVFWSNTEVGDVANLIDSSTEWTAEVIWQDIDRRAINFCDADGKVIAEDSINGKGKKPFYIKAVVNQAGNVIVGIKKKGAGTDAYLWSWHLWLTEEPQEIAGFMDRNLGATSSKPTDGSKTYGLYYQFGRKDPFKGYGYRYKPNGETISPQTPKRESAATLAYSINVPYVFCGTSRAVNWVTENKYTNHQNGYMWYNLSESKGKSLFDPSPEGWKIPEYEAFSVLTDDNFPWDTINKGRTYNGNWFPATGYRGNGGYNLIFVQEHCRMWASNTSVSTLSNMGFDFQFQNSNVYTRSSSFTVNGQVIRCVKE